MRVVSVLPSATEIVYALGHGAELVGRSAECDYPLEATRLPVVMHPKTWDSERPSREIDARVRSVRSRGESLYTLDVGLLRELRPDLLLTQDLCGVCSVTEAEAAAACTAAGVTPKVVSLTPRRLTEVWDTVRTVGRALGDAPAADRLLRGIEKTTREGPARGERARVAVVEWLDPPILAGLWTPDIVRRAGASAVGPAPGEPGVRTTWSDLAARPVDLLILSPCSFPVGRTVRELGEPALRAEVGQLSPRLGTFVADEAYFSRPGPRLADGIRLVRDLLEGTPRDAPMPVTSWGPGAVRATT
jgi:iron complex transport system substrate-binding protein